MTDLYKNTASFTSFVIITRLHPCILGINEERNDANVLRA